MTHSKIVHVLICVPTCQPIKHSGVLLHSKLHYSFQNNCKCHGRILSHANDPTGYETKTTARVSFSFLPKWGGGGGGGGVGKMRLYGLLRGQVHICVQSMWQTIGGSGDIEFGHFIRRNLADPWNVFA